ncbi:MAG: 8-amino-7-oxononanoate synthase [Verrucomicrobiota bacterium]
MSNQNSSLDHVLAKHLVEDKEANFHRELRTFLPSTTLYSENDYLGLASYFSEKKQAHAVHLHGAGAARLLSGNTTSHEKLEAELATFKNTQAALSFSTGYAAACGTIPAVLTRGDFIVMDKAIHACFIDASRISEATIRVFAHNDLKQLEEILKHIRLKHPSSRILIIVESLYSMHGDFAPLREIVSLKKSYDAWLMVDEAHATGIYGKNRRGKCEELHVADQVEIQMGTLGKAIGTYGGYIAGSKTLIDYLTQRARSFMFTTACPPLLADLTCQAIQLVKNAKGESLKEKLLENILFFTTALSLPYQTSPIQTVQVSSETRAMEISQKLLQKKIYVPAIRYPTVPKGQAVLRISITAKHSPEQLLFLSKELENLL